MGSACYRYRSGGIRGRESRFPDRGRKLYRYTVVRTRLFCRESRFPDRGRKSCTVFVSELCDVVEKVDSPIGDENSFIIQYQTLLLINVEKVDSPIGDENDMSP